MVVNEYEKVMVRGKYHGARKGRGKKTGRIETDEMRDLLFLLLFLFVILIEMIEMFGYGKL